MRDFRHVRRDAGEATAAAARKIWVFLELLRSGSVRFSTYGRFYAEAYRSFQRDLRHLRKIGRTGGFTISAIRNKERAELLHVDAKLRSLDGSASVLGLLSALGGALGAPVTLELGELAKTSSDSGFPSLSRSAAGRTIGRRGDVPAAKGSLGSTAGPARFAYPERDKSGTAERVVEPYIAFCCDPLSAYLVGYDTGRKGWRMLALDRIGSKPPRVGTLNAPRVVPAMYESSMSSDLSNRSGRP